MKVRPEHFLPLSLGRRVTMAKSKLNPPDIIGSFFERMLGRKNLFRLSRLLMYRARRDSLNEIGQNGELLVQQTVLHHLSPTIIFDVGANVGDWSAPLLRLAEAKPVQIHAFEPCAGTIALLRQRLADPRMIVNHLACSDHVGQSMLNVVAEGSGVNTLVDGIQATSLGEVVELITIDGYCTRNKLEQISLLKIDAEGHDFMVLLGAKSMLQSSAISVLQFEYNSCWIHSRHFLKDVFDLLLPLGYCLGKVTAHGIERYDRWDSRLETFCEANFIACLPANMAIFKTFSADWIC